MLISNVVTSVSFIYVFIPSGSSLSPAVIEEGKQSLMVMGCFSPTEIYLALKGFPEEVINKLHKLGANSDYVNLPKDGDLVFVFKEQCWNRAKVVRSLPNNIIVVEIINFPEIIQVEKRMVRKAPKEALDFPVLVGKCCLDSFYGKEEEAAKHVDKLRSLGLEYLTVEVEVLGSKDGVTRVKVPRIEHGNKN